MLTMELLLVGLLAGYLGCATTVVAKVVCSDKVPLLNTCRTYCAAFVAGMTAAGMLMPFMPVTDNNQAGELGSLLSLPAGGFIALVLVSLIGDSVRRAAIRSQRM